MRGQLCTLCNDPSVPGLIKGAGKCQHHWDLGVFGTSRRDELLQQRANWLKENHGSFLHLDDPRNSGRWAMACPDEADELSDINEFGEEHDVQNHQ